MQRFEHSRRLWRSVLGYEMFYDNLVLCAYSLMLKLALVRLLGDQINVFISLPIFLPDRSVCVSANYALRLIIMSTLEMKYGFPLFTKERSTVYMGNHKKLIISDIWSFWDYIIKKHKKNNDFLSALLEQSKTFYNAAESSPIKSKPLLYYYSFLNLSKILICIENGYSDSCEYMHGLTESHNGSFPASEIKIKSKHLTPKNVGIELLHMLDRNPPPVVGQ
jgi:hypothetical protein